jgi:phage-related protein
MMQIAVIRKGPEWSLYGLIIDDSCFVSDFLRDLDDQNSKQMFFLLSEIVQHGPPKNVERFRNLGDDIYELKARNGARIACFFSGPQLPKSLTLTHGFYKAGAKELRREKRKAISWRSEYFEIKDIIKRIRQLEVEP